MLFLWKGDKWSTHHIAKDSSTLDNPLMSRATDTLLIHLPSSAYGYTLTYLILIVRSRSAQKTSDQHDESIEVGCRYDLKHVIFLLCYGYLTHIAGHATISR